MRQSSPQKRYLLCYSTRDADGKEQLAAHLAPARGAVSIWSVEQVPPGAAVGEAFQEASAGCDAALLLLSADFFNDIDDPAFGEQVELLRQRHKTHKLRLVPILWRPCDWRAVPLLAELQPLPEDGVALTALDGARRDQALADIARHLSGRGRPVIGGLAQTRVPGTNILMPDRATLIAKSQNLLAANEADFEKAVDMALGIHQVPQLVQARHLAHTGSREPVDGRPLTEPLIDCLLRVEKVLLVGLPGSGKTHTLRTLWEQLLNRAHGDPSLQIPFFMSLSTFSQYPGSLREWLAESLLECAGIPIVIGQALLQHGQIFPLLDGLDEMAIERRFVALTELNELLRVADPALGRCIVCSRTLEYEQASVPLLLPAAMELQPLAVAQVRDAVAQAGPTTEPLAAALSRDESLVEMLSTPLLLTLAARACASSRDLDISVFGPVAVRQALYDAYVVQMLSKTTNITQRTTLTLRGLCWLAQYLVRERSSLFLIERMQPSALTTEKTYKTAIRLVRAIVVCLFFSIDNTRMTLFWGLAAGMIVAFGVDLSGGLATGLAAGLIFGLITKPAGTLVHQLIHVIVESLVSGIFVGLPVGLIGRFRADRIEPIEQMRWSWAQTKGHWTAYLMIGSVSGALVGLVLGMAVNLTSEQYFSTIVSKILERVMLVGLSLVLLKTAYDLLPVQLFGNADAKKSTIFIIIWLIVAAVCFGLPNAMFAVWPLFVLRGGVVGLVLGLVFGLARFFVKGWVRSTHEQSAQPNEGIHYSVRNGLLEGMGGGLLVALVVGLTLGSVLKRVHEPVHGIISGPISRLSNGIAPLIFGGLSGLCIWLAMGLRGGLGEAYKHYVLRLFLWREGKLPLRLVPWLEGCRSRLLLRRLGGGYQFWHITLQEYFAELDDARLAELAKRIKSKPEYTLNY